MIKQISLVLLTLLALGLPSCQAQQESDSSTEGTDVSVYRNIDLATFESIRSEQKEAVILDLRTPAETANGIIPGAIELDFRGADFDDRLAQLDRGQTYLLYCAGGGRSARAGQQMQAAGFREVYNLLGGYRAWSAAQ